VIVMLVLRRRRRMRHANLKFEDAMLHNNGVYVDPPSDGRRGSGDDAAEAMAVNAWMHADEAKDAESTSLRGSLRGTAAPQSWWNEYKPSASRPAAKNWLAAEASSDASPHDVKLPQATRREGRRQIPAVTSIGWGGPADKSRSPSPPTDSDAVINLMHKKAPDHPEEQHPSSLEGRMNNGWMTSTDDDSSSSLSSAAASSAAIAAAAAAAAAAPENVAPPVPVRRQTSAGSIGSVEHRKSLYAGSLDTDHSGC
jgi:hypothetical protein